MNLLWVTIMTDKYEESIKFYKEIVGLEEQDRFDSSNGEIIMLGKEDSAKIELIDRKDPPRLEGISVGFQVENLDEKIKELNNKSIKTTDPIRTDDSCFCFIKDPNGLSIQFFEKD